jgi:hypothetical protein
MSDRDPLPGRFDLIKAAGLGLGIAFNGGRPSTRMVWHVARALLGLPDAAPT